MKPLSLAEAKQLIEDNGGNETAEEYLKKFNKLKAKDAEALRKEIEALDNHKIKSEQIVKIVDFLPEDASDVNKIFTDISLDDNETKQVTAIVAKYK